MTSKTWQDISAAKQAARAAAIPEAWRIPAPTTPDVTGIPASCGVLTKAELAITTTPATRLVEQMVARELTSEAVVTAFCKRAAIAQQLTNCLTEMWFDKAIADAKEIDAEYDKTGKARGPLHGLPISLKDSVHVKGFDSSIGYINCCNDPAQADAELTVAFRNAGAVLYCKTNVPTAMVSCPCHFFSLPPCLAPA